MFRSTQDQDECVGKVGFLWSLLHKLRPAVESIVAHAAGNDVIVVGVTGCFDTKSHLHARMPGGNGPGISHEYGKVRAAALLFEHRSAYAIENEVLSPINAAKVRKAHALIEGGHVVGKIVVKDFRS